MKLQNSDLNMNSSVTNAGLLEVRFSTHDDIPSAFIKELPIIFLLIGCVLNAVLLYYLILSRKYRSPIFMLVTSLAITDLMSCMFGATWPAFLWPTLEGPAIIDTIVCRVCRYAVDVSATCSAHHLVLFAAIRFYQLCFPLKALARITASFVRNGCAIIWIIVGLAYTPVIYYNYPEKFLFNGEIKLICEFHGNARMRYISLLSFNTVFPAVAITLLHVLKYIRVTSAGKNLNVKQKRQNGDARAVTIVIILFFICWMPGNMYSVFYKLPEGHHVYQDKAFLITMYLLVSNSILNPLIYCFAAQSVREDIKRYLCRGTTMR